MQYAFFFISKLNEMDKKNDDFESLYADIQIQMDIQFLCTQHMFIYIHSRLAILLDIKDGNYYHEQSIQNAVNLSLFFYTHAHTLFSG